MTGYLSFNRKCLNVVKFRLPFKPEEEAQSFNQFEHCLDDIRNWMAANSLKLNDEKSELLLLGTQRNLSKLTRDSIKIGDSVICKSNTVRNIGAMFDPQLNMKCQVTLTSKSAWHRLYQIGKIRQYLTQDQTKSAIHAYVTSKIDQNNSLLIGTPDILTNKLQKVQNAAAKIIYKSKKFDHCTNLLKELHWLPISHRITFKILLICFKTLNNEGPAYLRNLLHISKPARTLRSSSDSLLLVIPKSKLKTCGDRCFSIIAPRLWNGLPLSIRQSTSTEAFKRLLKTFLFTSAYHC